MTQGNVVDQLVVLRSLAGSVPSRPDRPSAHRVLRADGARVILFSFRAGQELLEHTAPVPILVQALEGRLELAADGHVMDLVPGDLAHLCARLPHSVRAVHDSTLMLTMLDPPDRTEIQP